MDLSDDRKLKKKTAIYVSYNSILNKCKYVIEVVKFHLVKSFCLTLSTHCVNALSLTHQNVRELAVGLC